MRRANLYGGYDSKPTQPPDCGTMSEREIAERESDIQDRVDTKMLHLTRTLRDGSALVVTLSALEIAENEAADYDDAARMLFMFYAFYMDMDYLPASVRLAADEYIQQVRAVLTKHEEKKP